MNFICNEMSALFSLQTSAPTIKSSKFWNMDVFLRFQKRNILNNSLLKGIHSKILKNRLLWVHK